jgi:hypothetical protein
MVFFFLSSDSSCCQNRIDRRDCNYYGFVLSRFSRTDSEMVLGLDITSPLTVLENRGFADCERSFPVAFWTVCYGSELWVTFRW